MILMLSEGSMMSWGSEILMSESGMSRGSMILMLSLGAVMIWGSVILMLS